MVCDIHHTGIIGVKKLQMKAVHIQRRSPDAQCQKELRPEVIISSLKQAVSTFEDRLGESA